APRPRETFWVAWAARKNRGRARRYPFLSFEELEGRIVLSLASPPDQLLRTGVRPLAVQSGLIDSEGLTDLAVLGGDGRLTVALNGGNGQWRTVATSSLGVASPRGMVLGRFDSDPMLDLIVQGSDGIRLALGDGAGHFRTVQTVTPAPPATL